MGTSTTLARRALAVLLGLLVVASTALWSAPPARADEPVKVLLLLDVSGSMNEKISSGGTKFAAAKRALKEVAGSLPAGTSVGLRVYGSEIAEPKSQNPKACTDTRLVLPIGPLDQAKMNRAVDSFSAKGETPIAYSLGKAVDDLGPSGKRVLVLVSDGEETCSDDPCPTAEKLARSGVDLQFNAIGLDVNGKARRQLKCIADAGDGSYYDAGKAGDLSDALRKITQRALRPFQISGTPVQGTPDAAQAPSIGPGQYKDRYDVSGTRRYYRITRTPGSAVTASIASLVRPVASATSESWSLRLTTADGRTTCATASAGSGSSWTTTVVAGAVSTGNGFAGTSGGCDTDPTLLLTLARQPNSSTTKTVPVEIVVAAEPPVTNLASLPAAVSDRGGSTKAVSVRSAAKPVVGGSAFSNATPIGAGAWTDTSALGETLVYRVPLQPGQRLRVSLQVPAPGTSSGLSSASVVVPTLRLFAPSRAQLVRQYTALGAGERVKVSAAGPQVRVRNRELSTVNDRTDQASVAGDYYVGVTLDPGQRDLTGQVMALRLDVAVDGSPTGAPVYAVASTAPTPSAAPSTASATPDATPAPASPSTESAGPGGASVWGPLVAAAVVLAGLVAAAVALARRRSSRRGAR